MITPTAYETGVEPLPTQKPYGSQWTAAARARLEPESLFDTSLSIARVLAPAARRARDAVQARQ